MTEETGSGTENRTMPLEVSEAMGTLYDKCVEHDWQICMIAPYVEFETLKTGLLTGDKEPPGIFFIIQTMLHDEAFFTKVSEMMYDFLEDGAGAPQGTRLN